MRGTAEKRCVLGHGISYTLSPVLHRAIYASLGEKGEYSVEDIVPEKLDGELPRLMREYDGFNVTKPYKERVAAYLGSRDPVNTVRRDGTCTSTDPEGFLRDYEAHFGTPRGKILVLGAGGAAKSVVCALLGAGAEVFVYNRTYERAASMAKLGAKAVRDCAGRYDSVINCTSLGLSGEQAAPESLDFRGVSYAYDLVYSPPFTPFTEKARACGVNACGGLGMLIRQAIAAQEFWRGEKFDPETEERLYIFAERALIEELKARGEKI